MIFKFIPNERRIFLVDGFGAVLTALSLVLIVKNLKDYFGVPDNMIFSLASITGIYAVYSFICYLLNHKEKWKAQLKTIAIANSLYCFLTLAFIVLNNETIEILGFIYFGIEFVIIFFLVNIEWSIVSREIK